MKPEMIRYIAFLRAINVGGRKLIKMEALRGVLARAGLRNVRTYIQSGNVIFETAEKDSSALAKRIEKNIRREFSHEVTVILMTLAEFDEIVSRNSFKRIKPGSDVMLFVSFLAGKPAGKQKLPLTSLTENLDVIDMTDRAAFIVARRKKDGRFGFPNTFVEKQLGVLATTRNLTTVFKIIDFAKSC